MSETKFCNILLRCFVGKFPEKKICEEMLPRRLPIGFFAIVLLLKFLNTFRFIFGVTSGFRESSSKEFSFSAFFSEFFEVSLFSGNKFKLFCVFIFFIHIKSGL